MEQNKLEGDNGSTKGKEDKLQDKNVLPIAKPTLEARGNECDAGRISEWRRKDNRPAHDCIYGKTFSWDSTARNRVMTDYGQR